MKSAQTYRRNKRSRRQARVRARIAGTGERPRLAVFRSGKHIYAQIIDDRQGRTLAAASDFKSKQAGKLARARLVGETVAQLALAKKVKRIAFDRGGYLFAGRVRAVAEGARAGGLIF